ncbi:MAG: BRCT domain-containing protein [Desulfotomaculum sp.]|nr:BRCT domain-containing protein [Desulfotomaculum sp.]
MYFRKYTFKSELDKAIHTLEGILKGIVIDNNVNKKEIEELTAWYNYYKNLVKKHPFSELIPTIAAALDDNFLDDEELKNLLWLCNNLKPDSVYYDVITNDIQKLHGILHGILADNIITQEEIVGLRDWINENNHLIGSYPYDEINSVITTVLADGVLDEEEKKLLKTLFAEFVDLNVSSTIDKIEISKLKEQININGICATCPEIFIQGRVFCFTGKSSKTKRSVIKDTIESAGGIFKNTVSKQVDYLVVGDNGNPCWAFACYGRKVEEAIKLRKNGHHIMIVHENDFWDSLEDYVAELKS